MTTLERSAGAVLVHEARALVIRVRVEALAEALRPLLLRALGS